MKNMKITYQGILNNNNKKSTQKGRINWAYFSIFQEIFHVDKTMNATPVVISKIPTQIFTNIDSEGTCSTQSADTCSQVELLVSSGHCAYADDVSKSKRSKNDLDRLKGDRWKLRIKIRSKKTKGVYGRK